MANRYDFLSDPTGQGRRQRQQQATKTEPPTARSRYNFISDPTGQGQNQEQRQNNRATTPAPRTPQSARQQRTPAPTRTPVQGALHTTARFFDSLLHGATLGAFPAPRPARTDAERAADLLGKVGGFVIPVVGAKKTGGALAVRGLRRIAPQASRVAREAAEGVGIGTTLAAAEGAVEGRTAGDTAQRAVKAGVIGGIADAAISAAIPRVLKPFARKAKQAPQPAAPPKVLRPLKPLVQKTGQATQPATRGVAAMATQTHLATPTGQAQGTGITTRREIVDFLSERLDIPIRVRRYNAKRRGGVTAAGIFKEHPEVIRTMQAEDLPVISHEVGHYLDKTLNLRKPAFDGELLTLGQATSLPHYKKDQVRAEGVAEFMRLYLTDTAQAKAKAPGYFREFEAQVAKTAPETLDILARARQDIHNWNTQPAKARILGSISSGDGKGRKMTPARVYAATVDELEPLRKAVAAITQGEKLNVRDDPFKLAWLSRGRTGRAQTLLKHGIVDNNFKKIGKSFDEILRPVATRIDDFRAYIVARRANELHGRNIKTGLAQADVDEVLQTLKSAEFDKAFQDLQQYQNSVLQQLIDTGVMSQETAAAIRAANWEYVPFHRLFDESVGRVAGKPGGFANLGNPVHRIHGDERTIVDPLEAIIKNTYAITSIAERNKVGKALADLADRFEGSGQWVERVKTPVRGIEFQLDEVKSQLRKAGVDLKDEDLHNVATVFRPHTVMPEKENVLTVFRNGKAEYYQLEPELYRAMLALDREASSVLINLLSYPARMLRAGATLTPEFVLRNPLRDQFSAYIYSKYGFVPVVDTIRGLFHAVGKTDLYWKWQAAGGAHGSLVSLDRDYLQGALRGLLNRSMLDKTLNVVTRPLEAMRAFSEFTEHATRLGEFAKGVAKEGATHEGISRAALASRDITLDFSRVGHATRDVNRIVAFFNAQVQGMDKMARVWLENPKQATLRAMTAITLPSVLLYSVNRNDPRYQELPQWQKDIFWIIPTQDRLYRIPKPFELGILFGTLPERILTWIDRQDPRALEGLSSRLLSGFTPNVIPTALAPVIEAFANRNLFTGLPIIPRREEKLLAEYQYGPETPEVAKLIGRGLGVSPRMVESTIRGYTGGVGRYAMDIADAGLEAFGAVDPVPRPTPELADLPVARAFVAREFGPGAPSIERLYADMDSLERRHQSGHTLSSQEMAKLRLYQDAAKQLSWQRGKLREIMEAPGMTPEAKRAAIDYLNLAMINTARQAQGLPPLTRD